jgi:carbonic anhydrase/acetyltransferase-like protein (isoleucine patch superfamily)
MALEVVGVLYTYNGYSPQIAEDVFLAPGVHIIGRVNIAEGSSVWFNSVVRGDINKISIGKYTNIQDNSVVHVDGDFPTEIGDYVVVGHKVILHGCIVGSGSLIGMGAILLDGARVGENAMVAAGSVVRGEIPAGALAVGAPARVVRQLKQEEINRIREVTDIYTRRAQEYRLAFT